MIRRVSSEYHVGAEEGIATFIGKERLEKYRNIFPLLAILQTKANLRTDMVDVMGRLCWGDMVIPYGRTAGKALLHFLGSFILYVHVWVSTLGRKRAYAEGKSVCLFSNTFVDSKRYPAVLKEIRETYGLQTIVAACDALKSGNGSIIVSLRRSLKDNHGTYRPIFFLGSSIEGYRLNKLIEQWCHIFIDYQSGRKPDYAQVDSLLDKMSTEYNKRIQKIKKAINNYNIEAYITVNQYNLRDVMIIHACYQLGIRTIQLEHHAAQFSRINYSEINKWNRYAFAQEYCVWSESEKKFHNKVFEYKNLLERKKKPIIRVVGNIEVTYQQACQMIQKYPMERRLTFMTSALEKEDLDTPDQRAEIEKWRWCIFHELKILMERQNVTIRIRYTPFFEMQFREKEIPVLKQWGFEISESVPENLMDDMCSSMAIMSTTSTVLATARVFGRKTFRLEDPAVDYIQVDPKVIDISLEDISNIEFDEMIVPEELNINDFFRFDKMLN